MSDLSHQKTIRRELRQLRRLLLQAKDIPARSIFERSVYQLSNSLELSSLLQFHDISLLTRVLIEKFKSLGTLNLPMRQ
ncbi:MAG: hypothetical protein KBF71_05395, partial [Alphaproteobacteria bacterium]|nr:hypothetical protein [Alphaproteobacteria bacterium]